MDVIFYDDWGDEMKLAYSTNGFTSMSLPQAIDEIGLLGYEGVEILADVPHAFPLTDHGQRISLVKEKLEYHDLQVSNINGNTAAGFFKERTGEPTFEPSLCNANDKIREKRINYTKKLIDLASVLEAKNISITSGMCLPGNPPQAALKRFRESLLEIMDYAEKKEINVGIEYEPGLLIENNAELLDLIYRFDSKRLGANLDLGHAEVIGENIPKILCDFKSRIWNIHLEDIRDRKHYHLIPGEGTMNFTEIIQTLRSIDYKNFLTIELYTYKDNPITAAKKSISYLSPMLK